MRHSTGDFLFTAYCLLFFYTGFRITISARARASSRKASVSDSILASVRDFSICGVASASVGTMRPGVFLRQRRSEEHTSELQSPMYLVCRLLLEKKNS